MNKHHVLLLQEIQKNRTVPDSTFNVPAYLGTPHIHYAVPTPIMRNIAKQWVKMNQEIEVSNLVELLTSLYQGESYEERTLGSLILNYVPKKRQQIDPRLVYRWLEHLTGWAEVDTLCQSNFTATELLSEWKTWKALLHTLSIDAHISRRRASLVLLTKPVRQSADTRLSDAALENIERLKHEKDVLITKAVSWVLRSLITNHRNLVIEYVNTHEKTLPKIAVRETKAKLLTGKK